MAQQNRTVLKGYFNTGDTPTEAQFADLIDSFHNPTNDGAVQIQPSEGAFANGDKTKLDGIEAGADVTDAANVETAIEAITLSSVSGATGDEVLIVDATDGGLKAVLWENLPGAGGGMSSFSVTGDSGTPETIGDGNTLDIAGGTGITTAVSATDTVTINIDSTVATLTGTQTLSGKTIAGGTAAATTNTITIKIDSAADWTSNNPTLAAGEFGYESDTGKMKLGDGTTAWTSLAYWVTSLANPSGSDRVLIWDDSETTQEWGALGTGLTYSGTALGLDLTADEFTQLQNIGTTTISATQWGYLGGATATGASVMQAADAAAIRTAAAAAALGANVFTGPQDFNANQVEGFANKVVTSVTGTLTMADHSGNVLVTSGNVTVPTTAGFNAVIIAGGAHTVTFNSTTSAAMATGDVMTVVVESGTVIHAVLTAAADKVSFT